MTAPIVELRDVFCVHRTDDGDAAALQGMNLEVAANDVVCVLGPSGAGKSTLLRLIAGLQLPSAGIVNVLGSDVGRLAPRARSRIRHERIGFLGQRADAVLPESMSARDAVALPLALRGTPNPARERRADELLDRAGLEGRADALPGELSGGERQRVALCAALVHRPSLLLADEPTGELDEPTAKRARELIAELARAEGATAIVVSHDPATAEIADRTVRIRDGRVVEDAHGGHPALVIGPGGWLRLPGELLRGAGIGRRATARLGSGALVLSPAPDEPRTPPGRGESAATAPDSPRPAPRQWTPARVELRAVTRGYRQGEGERLVLDGLAHAFVPGRMTAVTGRSGSGKTTLLRLLAGLDRPDGGRVSIDELFLEELDAEELAALRRQRIGFLPQEPTPVGFLSAEENVGLVLRARGWDPRGAAERAAAALNRVRLAERASQRVGRLSAGEAQRVAMARALAAARGLVLADEPTSRLDEASAGEVAELLAAAATEDGQTVICATHDPAVIRIAHEVLALEGAVSTAV
jgi:ABC-type lipoprotein export system ATPase subunit